MARVVVFGGNGFLGSHMVDALAAEGHSIAVFDRMSSAPRFDADVEVVAGDFADRARVRRVLSKADQAVHAVWESTPISADSDPFTDITRNVEPSVQLMQAAVDAGVRRLVFFSTAGAMYRSSREPRTERSVPQPISPYGIGKLAVEGFLEYYRERYGLQHLIYRISNPYSGRQSTLRSQGVVPIFLARIAAGQPITIYGDGSMIRDYVYADDLAALVAQQFERDLPMRMYNLGSGDSASVNDVVTLAERVTGRSALRRYEPQPRTFVENISLDVSALLRDHDRARNTPLADGIARTWTSLSVHRGFDRTPARR